ncbi:hypothetical protein ACLK1S_19215 [Escherichia coli]
MFIDLTHENRSSDLEIGVITLSASHHKQASSTRLEEDETTPFMTEDFLLDTEFARRLYHDYAKDQPIFSLPLPFAAAADCGRLSF